MERSRHDPDTDEGNSPHLLSLTMVRDVMFLPGLTLPYEGCAHPVSPHLVVSRAFSPQSIPDQMAWELIKP